jgi:hypothetical protein
LGVLRIEAKRSGILYREITTRGYRPKYVRRVPSGPVRHYERPERRETVGYVNLSRYRHVVFRDAKGRFVKWG